MLPSYVHVFCYFCVSLWLKISCNKCHCDQLNILKGSQSGGFWVTACFHVDRQETDIIKATADILLAHTHHCSFISSSIEILKASNNSGVCSAFQLMLYLTNLKSARVPLRTNNILWKLFKIRWFQINPATTFLSDYTT